MDRAALRDVYKKALLDDIVPFWLAHGRDAECGGYVTCLDREGKVYDRDKLCMWHAGRIIWTFSFLYNELRQEAEWLDMARCGVEFVQKHGFAPDGSMYYALTRNGRPLQTAQDIYVETSAAQGFSEFARAVGDERLYGQARAILLKVWDMTRTPGRAHQPFIAGTRPARMLGHSMIILNVCQELRRFKAEQFYEDIITQCLHDILTLHRRPEQRALFELIGWDGERLTGWDGRRVCPGHMIEAGSFIIHEGQHRKDEDLVAKGVELIDWGFDHGWDHEFGGIVNDIDIEHRPVPTAEACLYDAKLWWQHAEALYATLLAATLTGEDRFAQAHRKTHDYSFGKFADPEFGEWYAAVDRRGEPWLTAKGSSRKSVFHIGRNLYLCFKLLDDRLAGDG